MTATGPCDNHFGLLATQKEIIPNTAFRGKDMKIVTRVQRILGKFSPDN